MKPSPNIFRPAPKAKRIVSLQTMKWVVYKRDGMCMVGLVRPEEFGECVPGALHGHHIETRGSGGDDVKENLITLCPRHHDLAHRNGIKREVLCEILSERFGYHFPDG
jgi:hypothetical protein